METWPIEGFSTDPVIAISDFGRNSEINSHVGDATTGLNAVIAMAIGRIRMQLDRRATNGATTWPPPLTTWLLPILFKAIGKKKIDTSKVAYDQSGQPLPLAHEDLRSDSGPCVLTAAGGGGVGVKKFNFSARAPWLARHRDGIRHATIGQQSTMRGNELVRYFAVRQIPVALVTTH